MAKNCIIDSGSLAALLDPREEHHLWARETLAQERLPWLTCEPVLSEALFLLHPPHAGALDQILRRGQLRITFDLSEQLIPVLDLRAKYADVPMSLADACLVRMTELLPDCVIITTDHDFKVYRRHGRQVVPYLMPY